MTCTVCGERTVERFSARIIKKYTVRYYECSACAFVQTEEPFWLPEAYARPMNVTDTGILQRNLMLRDITAPMIYFFFDRSKSFLDYAGGYGVFTRMMRDIGFNFLWTDPYTKNLFAQGFEYSPGSPVEMMTAFEVFEHFSDPMKEIATMLSISRTILFSTEIMPEPTPAPEEWWYYGLEHGQHIAFYRRRTLEKIAGTFGLNFYSNGSTVHLLTDKQLPEWKVKLLFRYYHRGIARWVRRKTGSKTFSDMKDIIAVSDQ